MEKPHLYSFLFALLLLLGDAIFVSITTPLYALNLDLLGYFFILLLINYAHRFPAKEETARREVSLRRVLAGERMLKKEQKSDFSSRFIFLQSLPTAIKMLLEYVNVGLLIGILIAYLLPVFQGQVLQQWRYWS